MDPTRDLNIWALANACQRLADLAVALSKDRRQVDTGRLQEVGRLVLRATEHLEREPGAPMVASGVTSGKKKRGGLLGLVLGGADDGEDVSAAATSEPTAPSPNHTLSLRGHEQLIPTPDLVNFLSSQKKTGLLEVVTPAEQFTLEFDNGDIVHAQSNRTPEGQRLGDILVSRNVIERSVLEQFLRTAGSGRLGETLVAQKWITQEQFLEALRLQIHWLFQRLFEQAATRFCFWSGPPLNADSNVRLNATALLLDGARAFDETHWMARLSADGTPQPQGPVPDAPAAAPAPAEGDWMNVAGS
ncbi:MAG: DUF4388 domain-containing protein [Planctomycetes bacterium]|nr:DUF4388 domain-containing protein [Planctomycetota bacterium]